MNDIYKTHLHCRLFIVNTKDKVSPHLTLRIALSIHARVYDLLGMVLPFKMIGSLLLRLTMQVLKKETHGPVPWTVGGW